ncbi:putative sensor histidine kinase/response regulator [Aspergillus stella-maris]|uniref:putative sensor histidine kinase/response regulator n=1 Tax=Aspergillus stella-maris TaxID=1810926 RepID=UPI003CCD1794
MASSRAMEQDHVEGRRTRELYRFFRPERAFAPDSDSDSGLHVPSAGESASANPPSPALSAQLGATTSTLLPESLILGEYNATLTSFAQLAALRLNVERVMISVSDRSSQFIIAQGSRLLLGEKKDYEAHESGIWDGCHTVSTAAWTMCRSTLNLPPSNRTRGECHFLEINDLSQDSRYKNLPFVKGDPHFRFYAGTPLTTEKSHINIGCFFILDTKPRNGLTEEEKGILGSTSVLIMNFLNVSRQASEGRRAARLSRGLSYFVDGSSSFVDAAPPSIAGSVSALPSTPPTSARRSNHLSVRSTDSFDNMPLKRSHSNDARSCSSIRSSDSPAPLPEWWSGSQRRDLEGLDQTAGNCWAFKRAANLLRESLELDGDGGVVFLEASNVPADIESGSDYTAENATPASVLAMSTTDEPFAPAAGPTLASPAANLDTIFLQQLLRRYSKGKLWSFHRDGSVSSSDDEKSKSPQSGSRHAKAPDLSKTGPKRWRAVENSLLNAYFPNATQVIFVPLWNAASSQWFAGCFCWNSDETRVFSPSVELSSVMGFGSSIMVEHSRLESLISDRQKGDFIGSISHELRSPLHGILAAAEFMSGTNLDEFQGSLLETINACSRTLLDTMNQVLDFSKIVSLERKSRQFKQRNRQTEIKEQVTAGLDTIVPTDIALLAEEVVEGVCLGHAYSQRSSSNPMSPPPHMQKVGRVDHPGPEKNVEVTVDIARNNWSYHTQPGALRRIIMNVFGNAMKYTQAGRISLCLEATESSDGRRSQPTEDFVTLTVTDTGKGISEEFLRGRIYTPFAQEDSLAVGTGLGLSIVRSLVKAMSGNIDIQSRPGKGTIVKVVLPLGRPEDEKNVLDTTTAGPQVIQPLAEQDFTNDCDHLRHSHPNKRVTILGMTPFDAVNDSRWAVIARYLTDWYSLELVSWPSESVDVIFTDEQTLANITPPIFTSPPPPLVIICNRSIDYQNARSRWSSLADVVSIITRPCGPHKLARTAQKCFDSRMGKMANSVNPPQFDSSKLPIRTNATLTPDTNRTPDESQTSLEDMSNALSDTPDLTDATSSNTPGSTGSTSSQAGSEIADPMLTITPTSPLNVSPQAEVPGKQERSPRVLVVDDNSINLSLMLTFMKKRQTAVLDSAENGQLAVEAVERNRQGFDLIFMDISMPVMNGFEATRAIRAIEKERGSELSTPATIIALTGLSSARDESEALASGIDLFLTKPVSFKEVSKLLEEWKAKATA